MKKSIFSLIHIIAGLFVLQAFAQSQTSEDEMVFLIKLTLFQESSGTKDYQSNNESLNRFLKLEFQIDTLEEKGFKDFIFLSINPKFKNPENISFEEGPFLPDNCKEYIVAMHKRGRTVYRLKGFAKNDFPWLMHSLKELEYHKIDSYKQFTNNYSVNNLDLSCLYLAFENYKSKSKYPCLKSCGELTYTH